MKRRDSLNVSRRSACAKAETMVRSVYCRPFGWESGGHTRMKRRRSVSIGTALFAGAVGLNAMLGASQQAAQAPAVQVDPLWPKPLPNHWILGSVTGVRVD